MPRLAVKEGLKSRARSLTVLCRGSDFGTKSGLSAIVSTDSVQVTEYWFDQDILQSDIIEQYIRIMNVADSFDYRQHLIGFLETSWIWVVFHVCFEVPKLVALQFNACL